MKFLIYAFLIIFTFINFSYADVKDCSEFKKLSKDYFNCTKDNLKYKSDQSGITDKVESLKSSKTLTDFFKKITNK